MKKKIAILPGDGIGPEVMRETLRVLDCIEKVFNHSFDYLESEVGGQAYDRYQSHCPEKTLKICENADAILFGSVGGPVAEQQQAKWKNCEINSILKIRKHFNFSTNIRPVIIYPALANSSPIKNSQSVDFVVFRELLGGIYFGRHERTMKDNQKIAIDESYYHENQIKQIAHAAFNAARSRKKRVHLIDKANVLATSKLWREIVMEIAQDDSEIELIPMFVDNCAMQMVINPAQFDIILTENMFGDILSDLGAALSGSIGMMPSASLNSEGFGLYEPAGGSAPDIANQNIANPCAQLLSAAMMLRYSFHAEEEAQAIEKAVKKTLSRGIATRDIKKEKPASTSIFIDAIIEALS
ncbi:MAG: 3-isopropylmalate dehydrogenase [Pseudomonadota bacterium]